MIRKQLFKPHLLLAKLNKDQILGILDELAKRGKIVHADLQEFINDDALKVPCSIFSAHLSATESICKYLKENLHLTYHQIAELLQRDDRTIWTIYQHALAKRPHKFHKKDGPNIPLNLFSDRTLSLLEHLVAYLKEIHGMRYRDIAKLLERDDRTMWTVYHRALKKRRRL